MSTSLFKRTNRDNSEVELERFGALGGCGLRICVRGKDFMGRDVTTHVEVPNESIPNLIQSLGYGFPSETKQAVEKAQKKSWWMRCFIDRIARDTLKHEVV
jgi:hypothetical protein